MAATKSKENFGIPPQIPAGLASVVESLARQVIKNRPKDVYAFAADHFEKLLKVRQQQQQQQQEEPPRKKNLHFTQVKENVIKTLATSTSIEELQKKHYIPQVQAIIDNSGPIIQEKLEELRKIRMQENSLEAQLNKTCNLLQDVSACFSTSSRRRPLSADAATNTAYRSAIGLEAMLSETRNLLVDISSTLPALVNKPPCPPQDECMLPLLNFPPPPKAIIQSNKENVVTLPPLPPSSFILPPETPENIPESITMVIIPDFGEAVVHEPMPDDEQLSLDNKPLSGNLQCINEESENGLESIESSSSAKETTATDGGGGEPIVSTSIVDIIAGESSNEAKETTITDGIMSDDTDRPFVPELNLDSLQDQTISSFKLTDNDDTSLCTTKRLAQDSIIAAAIVLQAAARGFLARRRLAQQQQAMVSKKRLYRENAIQQTTSTSFGNEMYNLMHTGEFHDCIPLVLHLTVMEKGVIIEEIVEERESPITTMHNVSTESSNSLE